LSLSLFHGQVSEAAKALAGGHLIPTLQSRFREQIGYGPSTSEVASWAASLDALIDQLRQAALEQAGLMLEYTLPLSSKRVDAIVCGQDASGRPTGIVVELKQWDRVHPSAVDGCIVEFGSNLVIHPHCQVCHYTDYIRDFNTFVHVGGMDLDGLSYLHEARSRNIEALRGLPAENCTCALFSSDEVPELRRFLNERLGNGSGLEVVDRFLNAPTRPSKRLLDHVAAEIEGREAFKLLDEQMVAFEAVKRAVVRADQTGVKSAIIVSGGPGTGKSVIAARLVGHFASAGRNVSHATGSKAFTETIRRRVGRRAASLFRYFNSFSTADEDELDVVICDEAHRIRASSNSRFTRRELRTDEPQVHELIGVARVSVFLLDENQVVRPGEIGTTSSIASAARSKRAIVEKVDLNGQFRCMGSPVYIEWVEALLGLSTDPLTPWTDDGSGFELRVADSPGALETWLITKLDDGCTARLAAGYCWPWNDPTPEGSLVDDIAIEDWRRPWNAKPGKKVVGAPPASFWASEPEGFNQVGCIYTAQGFEFDYVGVILGPDLVRRGEGWVIDRGGNADPIVKRAGNFDTLIRNVYKVLLTRGLRGCGVYSVDPETNRFLMSVTRG
jgi:hypothetical protein